MTAMVLVLMVGILGTMAYLSTVTDTKANTFTGSKGISLELKETAWDADGDDTKPAVPGEGRYDAENYTPGKEIAKNPTLTNSTTATQDANAQEWVAMAITFQIKNGSDYENVSYATLQNLISTITFNIDENSLGKWILLEPTNSGVLDSSKGYAIFMYSKPLKSETENHGTADTTRPLFDKVVLKDTTELTTGLTSLNAGTGLSAVPNPIFSVNGNLPEFKINVIGAAVKNEYKKWDSGSGAYTTDLAYDISELKTGDSTCDKEVLEANLTTILTNELISDSTLGFVTKPTTP